MYVRRPTLCSTIPPPCVLSSVWLLRPRPSQHHPRRRAGLWRADRRPARRAHRGHARCGGTGLLRPFPLARRADAVPVRRLWRLRPRHARRQHAAGAASQSCGSSRAARGDVRGLRERSRQPELGGQRGFRPLHRRPHADPARAVVPRGPRGDARGELLRLHPLHDRLAPRHGARGAPARPEFAGGVCHAPRRSYCAQPWVRPPMAAVGAVARDGRRHAHRIDPLHERRPRRAGLLRRPRGAHHRRRRDRTGGRRHGRVRSGVYRRTGVLQRAASARDAVSVYGRRPCYRTPAGPHTCAPPPPLVRVGQRRHPRLRSDDRPRAGARRYPDASIP